MEQTPRRQPMEMEEDDVLRQALQAASDPDGFLNMTLSQIANAPGPITNQVIAPAESLGQSVSLAPMPATPPLAAMTPPRPTPSQVAAIGSGRGKLPASQAM